MGFKAIVPKEYNQTRTNANLYIRISRADFYFKWMMMRIVVSGYATYESGLKMKLSEDYYRTLLKDTLDASESAFQSVEDSRELIDERSLPVESPYNEPMPLFSRSYNLRVPLKIDINNTEAIFAFAYSCIKTDSIYSNIEDLLKDPTFEEIKAY